VNLADAGCVAVGILEHLVDILDLDELVVHEHVGVLGLIATEHFLQGPALVRLLEEFIVVTRLLGLLEWRPVEHLHRLPVASHQEHGHRGGVVLLDDAVDDGYHRVFLVRGFCLAFAVAAHGEYQG